MPILTERSEALAIMREFQQRGISMPVFCTASHWNTEAILLAAARYAQKNGLKQIPVSVAITYNYPYMPQAQRVTFANDAKAGFLSVMYHLNALCGSPSSPYHNVVVLPHLDHADPQRDSWALTSGIEYLASVMFDAQSYSWEKNLQLTSEYVKQYGDRVLVEGIMDELTVSDRHIGGRVEDDIYAQKAQAYIEATGVDFLVADLGTEQQSSTTGRVVYLQQRAQTLTSVLKERKLVLHGTSSLTSEQMTCLASDGIIRVNMWTRIVREAGKYAAVRLCSRLKQIEDGDFEATESRAYLCDSIERAAQEMEPIFGLLNYENLKGVSIA